MAIESKSIDYVTPRERHGRVIDQLPFWFLGNFHFFTVAIGFVGPSMGLSFGPTSLAGTLGILFGTVFVAFHASQGPQLGLPQMIQSRAQFGFRGVVLVLLGTLFTFVGFNVADSVLSAQGLRHILGWSAPAVMIAASALAALLALYGHDWLHRIFRGCFYLSCPLYALLSVAIAWHRIPAHAPALGFRWSAFIAQFAASASYNITYAPSVSDYSRYLPRDSGRYAIVAAVYAGASASAIWLIILGAWLAARLGASDGLVSLYDAGNFLLPGFGVLLALSSVTALVATMGLNTYSGMLTIVTALNSLFEMRPTPRLRLAAIVALSMLVITAALASNTNSIELLFTVLTIMLYLLVPWTAINLVDYFWVRRGRYAIVELLSPTGIYGAWGGRGLAAYLIGFTATLPFCVLPGVYTGVAARLLGGVDLGWLVGLLTSGAVYLWLSRSFDVRREAPAVAASERTLGLD